ncbi:hypothetical protein AUP68_12123 [Ilyonectria robusta]
MTEIRERLAQVEGILRDVRLRRDTEQSVPGEPESPPDVELSWAVSPASSTDQTPESPNRSRDGHVAQQAPSRPSIRHGGLSSGSPAQSEVARASRGYRYRDLHRYLGPDHPSGFTFEPATQKTLRRVEALINTLEIGSTPEPIASKTCLDAGSATGSDAINLYLPCLYPAVEVFYVLFSECRTSTAIDFLAGYGSMTSTQIEEMLFALVNCTAHGQQRVQYLICTNYMAWLILHVLDASAKDRIVYDYQRKMRQTYFENVLFCLKILEVDVRPDITLLQATSCAAHMLHSMAHTRQCWEMNRIACQIGQQLETDDSLIRSTSRGLMFHIQLTLVRCSLQDKTMALYCEEMPSTPMPKVDVNVLNCGSSDVYGMTSAMFDLAKAQDLIVREIISEETQLVSGPDFFELMRGTRSTMDRFMSQHSTNPDAYWSYEWLCVDFMYYSILARGIHLNMHTEDESSAYETCLMNVREAVDTLISVLEHTVETRSSRMKCLGSLAWVVPFFLLWPLCFLFRQLLASSEQLDFKRLEQLSRLLEQNARIHSLDSSMAKLSKELLVVYQSHVNENGNRRD